MPDWLQSLQDIRLILRVNLRLWDIKEVIMDGKKNTVKSMYRMR